MFRRTVAVVGFALAGVLALGSHSASAQAPPKAEWFSCSVHLDWATMTHVTYRQCHSYAMPKATSRPVGWWIRRTRVSPHVIKSVRFPTFAHPAAAALSPDSTIAATGSYTEPMLVTYYLATGNPMANGIMPSVGWAACGYDLPLRTRVSVPGIGVLTCGDRIGYDPWHHIDVFGIPLGSGIRNVTVLG